MPLDIPEVVVALDIPTRRIDVSIPVLVFRCLGCGSRREFSFQVAPLSPCAKCGGLLVRER